nr:MAG TPA_asm: hypothetical protein [Caudoviricetes sp.]
MERIRMNNFINLLWGIWFGYLIGKYKEKD